MPGKILIVDDEVHIKMLLEQTLEELEDAHGVELLTASDGEEGLVLIRKERPDLVFGHHDAQDERLRGLPHRHGGPGA